MRIKENLINLRFGKLVVISDSDKPDSRGHKIHVDCICDCGNTCIVTRSSLKGNKNKGTSTKSCGCLKKTHFVDLTGNKYNHLTVTQYLGKDNYKNNIYESTCDCGGTIKTQGSDVKVGKIKSCGCKLFTKQIEDAKLRGNEPLIKNLFANYKRTDRGYSFDISYEYFKDIIQKNCHYCGSKPSNVMRDKRSFGNRIIKYNGIDRVDNDIGYTISNTVPCCRSCNIAKHTYTVDCFKSLVTNIFNNFVTLDLSKEQIEDQIHKLTLLKDSK